LPGLSELNIVRLFEPIVQAGRIALAVSGGPDSLALMLLATRWSRENGRVLPIVYSVDHGLRPEAVNEAAMVVGEATRLGLTARVLRWDGPKPETGVQAAARKARYGLMAAAMREDGAEVVLTAHHLGDLAETVLMRLAHGSGIEGLRGMDSFADIEGCAIFRPLLSVDPEDLREVVKAAGLTPAHDPSNRDRHYERVRWRQMMPALAELGLDPVRLQTFARRMADADAVIELQADAALTAMVYRDDGIAELPHAGLAGLPRAVGVRLLVKLLRVVGGDRKPHALGAVESLFDRLTARGAMRPATLHGCIVESDGLMISIGPEGARRGQPALISG
jgi:tRNA(Ile)-lysidine synthase